MVDRDERHVGRQRGLVPAGEPRAIGCAVGQAQERHVGIGVGVQQLGAAGELLVVGDRLAGTRVRFVEPERVERRRSGLRADAMRGRVEVGDLARVVGVVHQRAGAEIGHAVLGVDHLRDGPGGAGKRGIAVRHAGHVLVAGAGRADARGLEARRGLGHEVRGRFGLQLHARGIRPGGNPELDHLQAAFGDRAPVDALVVRRLEDRWRGNGTDDRGVGAAEAKLGAGGRSGEADSQAKRERSGRSDGNARHQAAVGRAIPMRSGRGPRRGFEIGGQVAARADQRALEDAVLRAHDLHRGKWSEDERRGRGGTGVFDLEPACLGLRLEPRLLAGHARDDSRGREREDEGEQEVCNHRVPSLRGEQRVIIRPRAPQTQCELRTWKVECSSPAFFNLT